MELDKETYWRKNAITGSMEIALMSEIRIDREQFQKDLDTLKLLNEKGDLKGMQAKLEEMKNKYE